MGKYKPKKEGVAENPSAYISLSAETAINRYMLDMKNVGVNELLAFAADVSLRICEMLKGRSTEGKTETEKLLAVQSIINGIVTETIKAAETKVE